MAILQNLSIKPAAQTSKQHKALFAAIVLLFAAVGFQLALNLFYNVKASSLNGGELLMLAGGILLNSFGVVACAGYAGYVTSQIEWKGFLHGVLATNLAFLVGQISLSFSLIYPLMAEGRFMRNIFCENPLAPDSVFCKALMAQSVAAVCMCAGVALVSTCIFLRLRQLNCPSYNGDFERVAPQRHSVSLWWFSLVNLFNFASFLGLVIRCAESIKMTVENDSGSSAIQEAPASIYILALTIGAANVVGNQRGEFALLVGGSGLGTCAYLSSLVSNFRALYDKELGNWCNYAQSQCPDLTLAAASDCIVAGSQLCLVLIGLFHVLIGTDLYEEPEPQAESEQSQFLAELAEDSSEPWRGQQSQVWGFRQNRGGNNRNRNA